jgi:hypothetical protein
MSARYSLLVLVTSSGLVIGRRAATGFGSAVFVLSALLAVGCGETTGGGGSGGNGAACEDNVCPCTEDGIRAAIAEGGGPYTFDCGGPITVVTDAELVIDRSVVLDGEGNLTVDGDRNHLLFSVTPGVTAELRGFTVTRGVGGIVNRGTLVVNNTTVSGSSGAGTNGGGMTNVGTLTVTDSTISNNTATQSGGGILNAGTLTLTNSTVSGNTAGASGGGGIFNSGTATLTNSTVSGNSADLGGGILNFLSLTLTSSTVSGNSSTGAGSGIYNVSTVTLTNTLVANACSGGATVSGGGNLESPGDTCALYQTTDEASVSAEELKLGPLADNGGPTQTHALLEGSVAIDVISEAVCAVDEDQRGVSRPQGAACDVGAFELEP